MMYDTFHANIEEKHIPQAIRTCRDYTVHVHISENDRSTPGSGHVDWDETFDTLKETGYNGWMVVEAFGLALPEIAAATKIWRRMYQSEEQLARDSLEFMKREPRVAACSDAARRQFTMPAKPAQPQPLPPDDSFGLAAFRQPTQESGLSLDRLSAAFAEMLSAGETPYEAEPAEAAEGDAAGGETAGLPASLAAPRRSPAIARSRREPFSRRCCS